MAPISVTLARREPPTAVVALVGEHDAYSSDRLQQELALLLEGRQRIVVDLTETTFMDSTTLSALLSARRRAEEQRLGFALVLPVEERTQVDELLDLTGLRSAFVIDGGLDDAIADVAAGRSAAAA
jgi:anti-sigma B factor antagonist